MNFEIKNRWTGNVQYACELSAEIADKSIGLKLGFAVKSAVFAVPTFAVPTFAVPAAR
jgi:hypothetical protein